MGIGCVAEVAQDVLDGLNVAGPNSLQKGQVEVTNVL